MHRVRITSFGILGVIALAFVADAQEPNSAYRAPRTSWGDPDLQGKWPGTNMGGVPLQRPESFGTRNATRSGKRSRMSSTSSGTLKSIITTPAGKFDTWPPVKSADCRKTFILTMTDSDTTGAVGFFGHRQDRAAAG